MATESNLWNVYTAGISNVGSYQVAGTPYLSASQITEQEKQFSFSYVSKRINMDVKCASIYISGSTDTGVQLAAELTGIPAARMYSLTGLEGM